MLECINEPIRVQYLSIFLATAGTIMISTRLNQQTTSTDSGASPREISIQASNHIISTRPTRPLNPLHHTRGSILSRIDQRLSSLALLEVEESELAPAKVSDLEGILFLEVCTWWQVDACVVGGVVEVSIDSVMTVKSVVDRCFEAGLSGAVVARYGEEGDE